MPRNNDTATRHPGATLRQNTPSPKQGASQSTPPGPMQAHGRRCPSRFVRPPIRLASPQFERDRFLPPSLPFRVSLGAPDPQASQRPAPKATTPGASFRTVTSASAFISCEQTLQYPDEVVSIWHFATTYSRSTCPSGMPPPMLRAAPCAQSRQSDFSAF